MTDLGLLALVRHEGLVPGPYLDVKQVWTFGIRHTAAAGSPDPATMPRGMPADLDAGTREAFRVFRADLARYERDGHMGLVGMRERIGALGGTVAVGDAAAGGAEVRVRVPIGERGSGVGRPPVTHSA